MIRGTLNNGGLEDNLRTGIWAEFARNTTFLFSIISIKAKDKCSYQQMFGSKPKLSTCLRIFGEMGFSTEYLQQKKSIHLSSMLKSSLH
jgi:hypothetical protein